MSDLQPDIKTQYAEGCSALRHYSTSFLNSIAIFIAQGFFVLSGAIMLIKEGRFRLSMCVSLFSLLFTSMFFMIHRNYWLYFDSILEEVVEIEKRANVGSELIGPWSSYKEGMAARRARRLWRPVLVYGQLILFLVAACVLLAANIVLMNYTAKK